MNPLTKCELNLKPIKQQITELVARSVEIGAPLSRKEAKVFLNERLRASVYGNEIYTVLMWQGKDVDTYLHEMVVDAWSGKCAYLSIRRNDREPCDSWRDFQEIKNQLCGPEREAVQVYPAESRLMDTANQYHLWVMPEGEIFPMGYFTPRIVVGNEIHRGTNARQSNR